MRGGIVSDNSTSGIEDTEHVGQDEEPGAQVPSIAVMDILKR